jgi:excinuclease ABC subunit C
VARLARAEVDEIASTPGIGPELARAVHEHLTGTAPVQSRESA